MLCPVTPGAGELNPDSRVEPGSCTQEREATVTTATAPSATPLTAVDRCDRCGAQAYLRVSLQGGGELLFCAHHAREHGEKLREIAAYVHDETDKLADTPTVAAEGDR
jgi:hypothetical protein